MTLLYLSFTGTICKSRETYQVVNIAIIKGDILGQGLWMNVARSKAMEHTESLSLLLPEATLEDTQIGQKGSERKYAFLNDVLPLTVY